jgi:SAM-dependent methyltransferase
VADEFPIPPADLSARIKQAPPSWAERDGYLERGRASRRAIEGMLPEDWSWTGKRVLDFGCGPGRVIRQFADESPECELWGCDISAACIDWNDQNLSPAISFFVNDEVPPLPLPDARFDLVYALSVFTHISDAWAAWLLEIDRVLAPDGVLVATFMGEGMCEAVAGEPWDQRNVGMNVYVPGQSWEIGGPMVLHSPWWIDQHWGRLFEIEKLLPSGFFANAGTEKQDDHGAVTLRKRPGRPPEQDELERIDPAERREATALLHDVQQLRAENTMLRIALDGIRSIGPDRPPPTGREGAAAIWRAIKRRVR